MGPIFMMNFKKSTIILTSVIVAITVVWELPITNRLVEGGRMYLMSKDRAKFYQLTNASNIQDITTKLATDKSIPLALRRPLISGKRRIIIFKYKSNRNEVAGYLSYLVNGNHPLLIFLRGGNGWLGIMRPNNAFSFTPGYNVAGTLYRGNIYGGTDECGGKDINDIENLMKFFPKLKKYTQKSIKPPYVMLGISRGATQMFDSLAHSSFVSDRVDKAISVSGAVDLETQMHNRAEMRYLFKKKFHQKTGFTSFEAWLKYRDPVYLVKYLKPTLRVLLIHGENDRRVSKQEQQIFINKLKESNISTHFIQIPNTGHGMNGKIPELMKYIGNKPGIATNANMAIF